MIVVAAVIERDGTFLVARRQSGVHLEGYWNFPVANASLVKVSRSAPS